MSRKKQDKCPNPLFEKWLLEWRDEANARQSKTAYVYAQALKSLRKYPLVLISGKEAKILEYFGDKICSMLDKKLEAHRKLTGEHTVDSSQYNQFDDILSGDQANKKATPPSKVIKNKKSPTKRTNTYLPKRRSGGYALLVALYKNFQMPDSRGFMSKSELLIQAQPLCDASFTLPEPGSYYTAWSTMATLMKKNLVRKEGHPPKFSLTDEGAELAHKIIRGESTWDQTSNNSSQATSSQQATTQSSQSDFFQSQCISQFTLIPGEFDIILCVDNAETLGNASERRAAVQAGLTNNGVNFDIRKLHVGDFVWIAKERAKPAPSTSRLSHPRELILDYIVERKRKDDLAHSIMDGRFKEQKARLKSCGLTRPIYLVEEFGKKDNFSIPLSSLQQAVVNTQIVDGFTIKNTKNLSESIAYLTHMTTQLQNYYSSKILRSVNLESRPKSQTLDADVVDLAMFEEFNSNAVKNRPLTVEETFAKQLMKVHGMSVDKVKALLTNYSTPSSLFQAYSECTSEKEAIALISNIKWGKSERNMGPAISQVLYQLYTKAIFP